MNSFFVRTLLLLITLSALSGCASVFDAPYVELEVDEAPLAQSHVDIEIEPEVVPVTEALPATPRYTDIWARMRAGFRLEGHDQNREVRAVARRLAERGIVQRIAERAGGLLFYVVESVDARGLPMELALLPFVESGFALDAASHAEAHGAWQFIESTARNYEVGIDRFRDDRRNLVVSTRAALEIGRAHV